MTTAIGVKMSFSPEEYKAVQEAAGREPLATFCRRIVLNKIPFAAPQPTNRTEKTKQIQKIIDNTVGEPIKAKDVESVTPAKQVNYKERGSSKKSFMDTW